MVDLTVEAKRETTMDELNQAMKAAADGPMKGILEYTEDPIVSTDIIKNPASSSIFDSQLTVVMDGTMVKVSPGTTTSGATPTGSLTWRRSCCEDASGPG